MAFLTCTGVIANAVRPVQRGTASARGRPRCKRCCASRPRRKRRCKCRKAARPSRATRDYMSAALRAAVSRAMRGVRGLRPLALGGLPDAAAVRKSECRTGEVRSQKRCMGNEPKKTDDQCCRTRRPAPLAAAPCAADLQWRSCATDASRSEACSPRIGRTCSPATRDGRGALRRLQPASGGRTRRSAQTGLARASHDVTCQCDAFLQFPPQSIPAVLAAVTAGFADVAIGSRFMKGADTWQNAFNFFRVVGN